MAKRVSLKKAVALIVSDVASSHHHWSYLKAQKEAKMADPSYESSPESWKKHDVRELKIAQAACDLIESTGRAPKSLVMGEAAAELGIVW